MMEIFVKAREMEIRTETVYIKLPPKKQKIKGKKKQKREKSIYTTRNIRRKRGLASRPTR